MGAVEDEAGGVGGGEALKRKAECSPFPPADVAAESSSSPSAPAVRRRFSDETLRLAVRILVREMECHEKSFDLAFCVAVLREAFEE